MNDVAFLVAIIRDMAEGYGGEYGHHPEPDDPDALAAWAIWDEATVARYRQIVAKLERVERS
jgi:hypothetical protein